MFSRLPFGAVIEQGLADLAARKKTEAALLVSIGAPRLAQLGFEVPRPFADPELRLYEMLAEEESDSAHGRYNALVRRLVSFERASACAS